MALDLLADLLSTGNEDDYLVASDICEQEQIAMPIVPVPHCWQRCTSHWSGYKHSYVHDLDATETSECDGWTRSLFWELRYCLVPFYRGVF
jgi:hypothetical protein